MAKPPSGTPSGKPAPAPAQEKQEPTVLEYEEVVTAPLWIRLLVYGVFLFLIGFLVLYPLFDELANETLNLSLAAVFLAILLMVRLFLSLRVSVFSTGIQFGYPLLNKRFRYSDVLDCRPYRYDLSDYLGWGIRKGADGSVLYNVPGDRGMAVRLTVREHDERKVYAFSAKRPEVISKRVSRHLRPVLF